MLRDRGDQLKRPACAAVSDLKELPDEAAAAISRIRERVWDDGTITIEVELHDKFAALTLLGKSVSMFKERAEVDHNHTLILEADPLDSINARLKALARAQGQLPEPEIQPPLTRAVLAPVKDEPLVIDAEK
jgi:hypothetical protein